MIMMIALLARSLSPAIKVEEEYHHHLIVVVIGHGVVVFRGG